jgi:hypothetical protein
MPKTTISEIPKQKMEALAAIMDGYSSTDFTKIFTWHSRITRLDRIHKSQNCIFTEWQEEYPITLEDYLAVRLWVAKKIDEIYPKIMILQHLIISKLQYIWLKAKKLAKELVKVLEQISTSTVKKKNAFQMLKWCFVLILDQS